MLASDHPQVRTVNLINTAIPDVLILEPCGFGD
jgi:hypothetical protein